MSEWKEYKLREVIDQFIDYRGKTPPKTDSGIPLITAKIIKGGRILEPNEFIAKEYYEQWMTRGYPEINDVILTTEAPLGEVALLKNKNVVLAQRIITLRGKKELCDNAFLKYYLQSSIGQATLQSRAQGSTVEGIKSAELREMEVMLPDLPEQHSIASILSSLDDKIDLLHRQNKTLEALAETLFRQWFVEEAEEGWEVCKLRDICSLITDGKHGDCQNETNSGYFFISAKDVKDGKVCYDNAREITKSDFEETHRRTNLTAGDILITNSGTIGRMAIIRDIPETRRTTFQKSVAILKPKREKINSKFLYCLLQSNYNVIVELAGGTTQQNLLLGDLKEFEFKYPGDLPIKEFDVKITPCFKKMFSNDIQIRTLTRLRDTLLPKLMSGEVRVKLEEVEAGL